MRRPSVLIADDHTIVAEGLVKLLSGRFEVVATVADGTALIEAAERLRPDIIVADLDMPSVTGLEALERLKKRGVDQQVRHPDDASRGKCRSQGHTRRRVRVSLEGLGRGGTD